MMVLIAGVRIGVHDLDVDMFHAFPAESPLAPLAQFWSEHAICNRKVVGSIPIRGTPDYCVSSSP